MPARFAARSWLALILVLACAACGQAFAQQRAPSAILLLAKPELADPNFRHSVVLVTRAAEGQTLGVVLNRPTDIEAASIVPRGATLGNYEDAVYFGGPVMPDVAVALFRSASPPPASLRVLERVYLTMNPDNVAALLDNEDAEYRLYAGFSAWARGQLEREIALGSWYVLPADEDVVLREDTAGLWEELIERASAQKASIKRTGATQQANR
jgi:putative transcriptional regulator